MFAYFDDLLFHILINMFACNFEDSCNVVIHIFIPPSAFFGKITVVSPLMGDPEVRQF
jgi:hypothetical protein